MKIFLPVSLLGLALVASPVAAAVVLAPGDDGRTVKIDGSVENGWSVGQPKAPTKSENPVMVLGNTLTSYASMLPVPADWMLLLTGFSVIGYAMRSRRRGPVSFS